MSGSIPDSRSVPESVELHPTGTLALMECQTFCSALGKCNNSEAHLVIGVQIQFRWERAMLLDDLRLHYLESLWRAWLLPEAFREQGEN